MSGARLSGLDASFLAVESPTAHMHVGWVALFSADAAGRRPSFAEVRAHIERRQARAPRYRQKLAPVPLGLRAPEWVDDPAFAIDRHVYWAPGPLHETVDEVLSMPLRRDRPLWEMWICEDAGEGQWAVVGKAHHCMVDGLAAVELGSLLLDPTPEFDVYAPQEWRAEPEPSAVRLLARGARDLAAEQLDLLRWPLRAAASPARAACALAGGVPRVARALEHSLRAAPASPLNRQLSPLRSLAWAQCPLEDLRRVRRAHGTSLNDVLLAAVAGGARRYLRRRGEAPIPLKALVPVSVRSAGDELGNRVCFAFTELPCEEPDPVRRLHCLHDATSRLKRAGEPEGVDFAFRAAEHTPGVVQHAISRALASPRTFNLVVSNIPGPPSQMYMLGCPLRATYPVVPLAEDHALSVGMASVHDRACFGVYADREALPDAGDFARDLDAAVGELVATVGESHAR